MEYPRRTWLSGLRHRAILTFLTFLTLTFSTFLLSTSVLAKTQGEAQEYRLSEAELAQTLAPIALYPDSLLTHILIAATYPLEVIEAERWLVKNAILTVQQTQDRAEDKPWDASVKALLAFPRVMKKLSDELVWTQTLGAAFLEDEERVLDSIQTLRYRAKQAGSLDNLQHVQIITEQQEIIIESNIPSVIYVPYYDTRVVYGRWHWASYPPVFWHNPSLSTKQHKRFSWGYGVRISSHFFFSAFHWQNGNIIINHQGNGYFPRKRIVSSQQAKRWAHQPKRQLTKQRNSYSTSKVAQKQGSSRPNGHYNKIKQQPVHKSLQVRATNKKNKQINHKTTIYQSVNKHKVKAKSGKKSIYSSTHKTAWKERSKPRRKEVEIVKVINKKIKTQGARH